MKLYYTDPIKGPLKVGSLYKKPTGLVFRKNVTRSKHYFKVVKGYGIQKEIFDKYLRGKKGVIQIKEDTGKFLVASIDTWTEHSKSGNYGDGKQIFLSERFMHNGQDFNRETTEEVQDYSMPLSVYEELKRRNPDLIAKIKHGH
jgi:hypothetical protein